MKDIVNGQDFEILNPPYKDLAIMFQELSDLYKNTNGKTLIDDMVRQINNPAIKAK